ncbi:MAG: LysM peptidoglycan-binding domain-containing protein [Chitinivibrionia bacterium]|nr:LysM peptidoglycan-binding domain-containing protein [Chitinivibrionia bacterium]
MRKHIVSLIIIFVFGIFAFAQVGTQQPEANLALGQNNAPNYTVIRGDNLWDLATTHLGDPFMWRRIWEFNRWIADPHWIFPGNMLFIPGIATASVAEQTIVPAAEITLFDTAATLPQISNELERQNRVNSRNAEFLSLFEMFRYHISLEAQIQQPFVYEFNRKGKHVGRARRNSLFRSENGAIRSLGKVVINDGRPLVRQHQNANVKLTISEREAQELVKVGEELGFFVPRYDIRCKNGVIVVPVALGTVRETDGNSATIFTEQVWGKLSRGAILAPVRDFYSISTSLTYRPLSDSLKIQVAARLRPSAPIKPFEAMFINKGARDGIVMGDHIVLVSEPTRRSVSRRRFFEPATLEGLVVGVEDGSATVRITSISAMTTADMFNGVRIGRVVARD